MAATAVRTVLDLFPAILPLFAPGEGPATGEADLGGQVRFFALFGHRDPTSLKVVSLKIGQRGSGQPL